MKTFFTDFELGLLANVAVFVATLVFAQKIKDWFTGVPTEVRAALKGVEASALGNVKAAQSAVLGQLATALPPVAAAPAPAPAPAAPVAPAPAAPAA